MGEDIHNPSKRNQSKTPESIILAAKNGDWTAKNQLAKIFSPLITSLAEKRGKDIAEINTYIDAGKQGLIVATKKYKTNVGADKFQIFALDFIEAHMNRTSGGGSFLSRLFGK